uniref:Neutrophil cytosolic factor 1 n=1 Tax=Lates calcarifer TaxID=8187 RepID=A0A4W6F9K1_LATCA
MGQTQSCLQDRIYVRHVELLGFEKRDFPSQHYVYMLMVKWSDLTEKLIYRTYPEMHTLHKSLKEMFPIEAGQIERKDRIIPSLPAPRWVDTQKSTETRQSTLADYCRSLVNLPPHISRCKHLTNFFKVRPEDENPSAPNTLKRNETFVVSRELNRGNASDISGPIILDSYRVIADFTKTSKHEINLHTGDLVEIVEKNQNGWWFCQCEFKRGWVPASYLEPLDNPEEAEEAEPNYEGELYMTTDVYKAEQEDEISLEVGETIEVIHKLLDGWWVVRKGEETGHFPSMFLQRAGNKEQYEAGRTKLKGQKPPPRRSTIRNAKSIHNKSRQRLSQDAYRRNSRRYLQEKGRNSKIVAKSPLRERKNQNNIPKVSDSSSEGELKREAPVIPPRPSPELILERCTVNTRKKVSIHKSRSSSGS